MKFHRPNQGVTGVSSRFGNIIGQQRGALAMMAVSWRLVIRDGYLGEAMPLPPAPPLFHVLPPPPVFAGQSFILIRMIIFLLYVYFSRIVAQDKPNSFHGSRFLC